MSAAVRPRTPEPRGDTFPSVLAELLRDYPSKAGMSPKAELAYSFGSLEARILSITARDHSTKTHER